MKLLMVTRKVDRKDHLAGFIYRWVKEIGNNVDTLFVICLESGDISGLPENVKIFGLNKKNKLLKFLKFQWLAIRIVPRVSGIFCHMNPEYTIAIAPVAKIFRKKIVAWYTHGTVSFRMKLMEKLASDVVTASKMSFRLPSKKLFVLGHGINVETFKPANQQGSKSKNVFHLLTVSRISPTKDLESMIKAVGILNGQNINAKLTIVGAAGLRRQREYFETLKDMVKKMNLEGLIEFVGAVPNQEIVPYYQNADLFINMSGTGSLDKTVLEAMACECLVLTSNDAYEDILHKAYMVEKNNPHDLAQKIVSLKGLDMTERQKIVKGFRDYIIENHNLNRLAKKIVQFF